MPDERRSTRRARLSGVRVAYESSTGAVHQADVADLSREGLFIASAKPLAVGKRISLEIQAVGEPDAWTALGRIVWVRAVSESDELPAGMAVKIIDMDDSVAAAIDRLIETRERTEPGFGDGDAARPNRDEPRRPIPAREKTMLGIGLAAAAAPAAPAARAAPVATAPAATAAPAAPAARAIPSREKTMVGGVGMAAVDSREPSLPIDLVARKPESERPPPVATEPPLPSPREATAPQAIADHKPDAAAEPADTGSSVAPAPRRRSGRGWLLLLLVLVVGGASGYVFRDRLLPFWRVAVSTIAQRLR